MVYNGIDVSHHNGDIDWKKVKSSGIDFAMIRTGYGQRNSSQIDRKFKQNIEGAIANNINVGVYHYSYATNSIQATDEAVFCLEILNGYQLTYPVCFDIEDNSIVKLDKRAKTDICLSFLYKIQESGYYSMLYANKNWLNNHLYSEEILSKYDLWLAHYGIKTPSFACGIWQHSETGKINGISGNVDLDISYRDYPIIIKNKGLNKLWNAINISTNNVEQSQPQIITYTVKKGDTLWSIATQYLQNGNRYQEIKELNNLKTDNIYVGQVLKIKK